MSGLWVHLVLQAQEVLKVPMELMDHKDLQDPLVQLVVLEKRVSLEKQETQGLLGKPAQEVPKEKEERKVKPVPLVLLDLPVLRDHQGTTVLRATRVLLVFLEILVLLGNLALEVKTVLVETRVKMETPGNRVLLAHRVRLAHQALLEKEVLLVLQVQKEDKVKKVPREKQVLKVLLEKLVQLVLRDLPESLVRRVFGESLALWENKGSLELQARTGPRVRWDLLDYQVSKVTPAPRERRDILV